MTKEYRGRAVFEADIGLLYYGHNLFGPPPETPDYDITELAFEVYQARYYHYLEWAEDNNEWAWWWQIDPTYRYYPRTGDRDDS